MKVEIKKISVLSVPFVAVLIAPLHETNAELVEGADKPGVCKVMSNPRVALLERLYERDEFRIFYSLEGEDALPDLTDVNMNGIPDRVEDVATQLVVARDLYSGVMGLTHPLQQPRYAQAVSIDVSLVNAGGGGASYDEVINLTGRCTLRIDLSKNNPAKNVSPAHELFHLYQWGASMFKLRWFMEGTARWSEHALLVAPAPEKPLPPDEAVLEEDFVMQSYAAGLIWNRLAILLDPVGRLNIPPELQAATYVNGTKVVQDSELHGVAFMKELFEEMGKSSTAISEQKGWLLYNWREADQRSAEYDAEILRAIFVVAKRQAQAAGIVNAELAAFLQIPQIAKVGQEKK
jgi:hypothetical protein